MYCIYIEHIYLSLKDLFQAAQEHLRLEDQAVRLARAALEEAEAQYAREEQQLVQQQASLRFEYVQASKLQDVEDVGRKTTKRLRNAMVFMRFP